MLQWEHQQRERRLAPRTIPCDWRRERLEGRGVRSLREDISTISNDESEDTRSKITSGIAGISTVESEGCSNSKERDSNEIWDDPRGERLKGRGWDEDEPAGIGVALIGEMSDEEAEDSSSKHLKEREDEGTKEEREGWRRREGGDEPDRWIHWIDQDEHRDKRRRFLLLPSLQPLHALHCRTYWWHLNGMIIPSLPLPSSSHHGTWHKSEQLHRKLRTSEQWNRERIERVRVVWMRRTWERRRDWYDLLKGRYRLR